MNKKMYEFTLKHKRIAFNSSGVLLMNEASLAIGRVVYSFRKLLMSEMWNCCWTSSMKTLSCWL